MKYEELTRHPNLGNPGGASPISEDFSNSDFRFSSVLRVEVKTDLHFGSKMCAMLNFAVHYEKTRKSLLNGASEYEGK